MILLCWERPDEKYCHRWTLSRWLEEQAKIVVPELKTGGQLAPRWAVPEFWNPPRREDATEMRLF